METLKDIREAIGLKQYEAAEKLDITKDYICMLEKGKRQPSNKLIIKMAKLYNTEASKIFLASNRTICTNDSGSESA